MYSSVSISDKKFPRYVVREVIANNCVTFITSFLLHSLLLKIYLQKMWPPSDFIQVNLDLLKFQLDLHFSDMLFVINLLADV